MAQLWRPDVMHRYRYFRIDGHEVLSRLDAVDWLVDLGARRRLILANARRTDFETGTQRAAGHLFLGTAIVCSDMHKRGASDRRRVVFIAARAIAIASLR